MKCEESQEQLIDYAIDLDSISSIPLQHMKTCTHCKAWISQLEELTYVWEHSESVPGLDLVTPVMQKLEAVDEHINSFHPKMNQPLTFQIFHFSLAASIALMLFHFGIFEQSGTGFLQTMELFSHKMQNFAHYITNL